MKSIIACSALVAQPRTKGHLAGCGLPRQVRTAFVETVGEWLVSLHERVELKEVHHHHYALQCLPNPMLCLVFHSELLFWHGR